MICGAATNAEVALEEIAIFQPDIAILDIRVEGAKTGVWLGNQLEIPFIYLTAFNDVETIKKAIVTKPVSYLVKPFNKNDLFIAVELAVGKIKSTHQIIIKDRGQNKIVLEDDIMYVKKEEHYLALYLTNEKKITRFKIKEFLEETTSSNFIQVHRSYVVNKNYVTAFNRKEITIGNERIPISKTFVEGVLKLLSK